MGFDGIIRNGVRLADRLTTSLQELVTWDRWTSADSYDKPTYNGGGAGTTLRLVVDYDERAVRRADGTDINIVAKLIIPRALTAYSPTVAEREGAVDGRDRFTLKSGKRCFVHGAKGIDDPTTGIPYAYEVALTEG